MLNELRDAMAERGIIFTYTDEVAEFIAKESYSVKYGARNMRRYIQQKVEDMAAGEMIASRGKMSTVSVTLEDGALKITAV